MFKRFLTFTLQKAVTNYSSLSKRSRRIAIFVVLQMSVIGSAAFAAQSGPPGGAPLPSSYDEAEENYRAPSVSSSSSSSSSSVPSSSSSSSTTRPQFGFFAKHPEAPYPPNGYTEDGAKACLLEAAEMGDADGVKAFTEEYDITPDDTYTSQSTGTVYTMRDAVTYNTTVKNPKNNFTIHNGHKAVEAYFKGLDNPDNTFIDNNLCAKIQQYEQAAKNAEDNGDLKTRNKLLSKAIKAIGQLMTRASGRGAQPELHKLINWQEKLEGNLRQTAKDLFAPQKAKAARELKKLDQQQVLEQGKALERTKNNGPQRIADFAVLNAQYETQRAQMKAEHAQQWEAHKAKFGIAE